MHDLVSEQISTAQGYRVDITRINRMGPCQDQVGGRAIQLFDSGLERQAFVTPRSARLLAARCTRNVRVVVVFVEHARYPVGVAVEYNAALVLQIFGVEDGGQLRRAFAIVFEETSDSRGICTIGGPERYDLNRDAEVGVRRAGRSVAEDPRQPARTFGRLVGVKDRNHVSVPQVPCRARCMVRIRRQYVAPQIFLEGQLHEADVVTHAIEANRNIGEVALLKQLVKVFETYNVVREVVTRVADDDAVMRAAQRIVVTLVVGKDLGRQPVWAFIASWRIEDNPVTQTHEVETPVDMFVWYTNIELGFGEHYFADRVNAGEAQVDKCVDRPGIVFEELDVAELQYPEAAFSIAHQVQTLGWYFTIRVRDVDGLAEHQLIVCKLRQRGAHVGAQDRVDAKERFAVHCLHQRDVDPVRAKLAKEGREATCVGDVVGSEAEACCGGDQAEVHHAFAAVNFILGQPHEATRDLHVGEVHTFRRIVAAGVGAGLIVDKTNAGDRHKYLVRTHKPWVFGAADFDVIIKAVNVEEQLRNRVLITWDVELQDKFTTAHVAVQGGDSGQLVGYE